MISTIKALWRIRADIATLPEHHEIGGHVVSTEFICNWGFMSRCSRHKAYVDGKAVGWYEEGPCKSWMEDNWTNWILDSVYFTSEHGHAFPVMELPYSDPPLFSPVAVTPEAFLALALQFNLVP